MSRSTTSIGTSWILPHLFKTGLVSWEMSFTKVATTSTPCTR